VHALMWTSQNVTPNTHFHNVQSVRIVWSHSHDPYRHLAWCIAYILLSRNPEGRGEGRMGRRRRWSLIFKQALKR